MKSIVVFLLSMLNVSLVFAGCLSSSQLAELTDKETNYLSEKIPPAFKHALQDKTINVEVESAEGEGCTAKLVVDVPQEHIDEANAVLNAQPAKKIMLSAQGYTLPQNTRNEANFNVDVNSLKVADADILQTAAFGKLRASLELMYAFISQKRAVVKESQQNTTPWPDTLTEKVVTSCTNKKTASFCSCVAEQYAVNINPKQMEYIQYIQENPYALATGANDGFEAIKQKAEAVCKA